MYKKVSGTEDLFLSDAFFKTWCSTKPGERVVTCVQCTLGNVCCQKVYSVISFGLTDYTSATVSYSTQACIHQVVLSGFTVSWNVLCWDVFFVFTATSCVRKNVQLSVFRTELKSTARVCLFCRSFDETAYVFTKVMLKKLSFPFSFEMVGYTANVR